MYSRVYYAFTFIQVYIERKPITIDNEKKNENNTLRFLLFVVVGRVPVLVYWCVVKLDVRFGVEQLYTRLLITFFVFFNFS